MQRKSVFLCCQSFHHGLCSEFQAPDVMGLYDYKRSSFVFFSFLKKKKEKRTSPLKCGEQYEDKVPTCSKSNLKSSNTKNKAKAVKLKYST